MTPPHFLPSTFRIGSDRIGPRAASLISGLLLLLPAMLLSGCADIAPGVDERPSVTSDGLVVARSTRRSMLWVKPNHHLGRYDDVLVNVAGFLYADGQEPLDRSQELRIRQMLQTALSEITADGPVGVATRPGPCVVTVNLGLKDLRLHTEEHVGSSTSFVSSFGSTTMVVEFRDSRTNVALLRYMASRGLGSGPSTGQMGADLNRLGATLGDIVTGMVNELQTIVPTTTGKRSHECKDGIYALTGRG